MPEQSLADKLGRSANMSPCAQAVMSVQDIALRRDQYLLVRCVHNEEAFVMSKLITILATGLLSLGLAPAVSAWQFSPAGSFTADGKVSMIKNGSRRPACAAHFSITVDDSGIGHFVGGSFTDIKSKGCNQLVPANLPWKAVAKNAKTAKVMGVTIDVFGVVYCGPSTVPVTLKSGVIGFAAVPMAGGCTVSGHLTTSPTLSIVP
jgi:hypothetical protein